MLASASSAFALGRACGSIAAAGGRRWSPETAGSLAQPRHKRAAADFGAARLLPRAKFCRQFSPTGRKDL
jgi:hypothetical protein